MNNTWKLVEEIDNELDWFLSEQTWEEYFNEGYEESEHE